MLSPKMLLGSLSERPSPLCSRWLRRARHTRKHWKRPPPSCIPASTPQFLPLCLERVFNDTIHTPKASAGVTPWQSRQHPTPLEQAMSAHGMRRDSHRLLHLLAEPVPSIARAHLNHLGQEELTPWCCGPALRAQTPPVSSGS